MTADAIQLADDAHLHLFRSLIGKGHGKDGTVAMWVQYQQLNVFCCQSKGFSGTCTGFIDNEGGYHLLNSSMVNLQPKFWNLWLRKPAKIPVEK